MFVARTGLKTRGPGASGNTQSGLTALLAPKRKRKEDRVGFYCWIPFMLRPCFAGFIGLFVLLAGTAMSVVGYYATDLALEQRSNGTHTFATVNKPKRFHINNLSYVGPVVMGFGCFTIVVACVVVCEYRDKEIRVKIEEDKKKRLAKWDKKRDLCDSVVERLKKSKAYQTRKDKPVTVKVEEDSPVRSERERLVDKSENGHSDSEVVLSCYSNSIQNDSGKCQSLEHISKALESIPFEILALNLDSAYMNQSSFGFSSYNLHNNTNFRSKYGQKYLSESCVVDMTRLTEKQKEEPCAQTNNNQCINDSRLLRDNINNKSREFESNDTLNKVPNPSCSSTTDEMLPRDPSLHTQNTPCSNQHVPWPN